MIITKLQGGLGNQLFQYALGRTLAYKYDSELKFDITPFTKDKKNRVYTLSYFNIVEKIASRDELKKYKRYKWKNGRRYFFHNLFFSNKSIYIQEKQSHFDKNILEISNDIYLDGYWQSEKYFKNIENIIRKEFTLKKNFQEELENTSENALIKSTDSIAIHIRRGDNATDPRSMWKYGTLRPEYYYESVDIIAKRLSNPHLFIFSDDINWVKNNMNFKYTTSYVNYGIEKDYLEFNLMKNCKHNIISNSSFSWWAAWLNQNSNKIIIAPKKWYKNSSKNTKDLVPKSWIRI